MEICKRCFEDGRYKLVEPAYAGFGRYLCENCQCDVWAGLGIRRQNRLHFDLQPSLKQSPLPDAAASPANLTLGVARRGSHDAAPKLFSPDEQ